MKRNPEAGAEPWGEAAGYRQQSVSDPPLGIVPPKASDLEPLQLWRRTVVRLWLATMTLAAAVGVALSAFRVPLFVEISAALALLTLAGFSLWKMRRGECPFCSSAIRFRPRIELPPICPRCAAPLMVNGEQR